ncbi:MAG TPA: hypothetical protein VL574_03830 [Stellaceae bacterium]|nr:hypothetical protein [Stellaceae bacterium]
MTRETGYEADIALLIADTQAQLDAANAVLREGGLVEIQDLAPRVQTICEIAVAQKRTDVAPALLALMTTLDLLEALLRNAIAKATAMPENNPRQAAKAYQAASEGYGEEVEKAPSAEKAGPKEKTGR